ncbi:hypothetical protein IKD57_03440 [Candidatus Saccharibacteria bacterium]|nr:hypothetical protein [Candidatus Saccharibacteria bacterium]
MKHNRLMFSISLIGLIVLAVMLATTSPTAIGPFGVLLFFTTLYITLFGILSLVLQIFYRLAFRKDTFTNKDYLYTAVMSFGPIMIMMARSFGAINLWTITLIILFLFLAEFLVYKRA